MVWICKGLWLAVVFFCEYVELAWLVLVAGISVCALMLEADDRASVSVVSIKISLCIIMYACSAWWLVPIGDGILQCMQLVFLL